MEAADQRRGAPGPEEPIAVVGIACQFPGADDMSAFWRLLEAGESGVTEGVPGSGVGRVGQLFPETSAQAEACRFGAFLEDLDQFDPAFFRMSPIAAQRLDPQQRLMLETSWRALEDAGMDADRLKGSRTGVYAGIRNYDYRALVLRASETAEPAASLYSVTGTSFNTAIGRVAFVLGLRGPAIALDTACLPSLVAVHQAVMGLQRGEADLALAGACTRSFPDGYSKCARTRGCSRRADSATPRRLRQRLCARRRLRHLGPQAPQRGGSRRGPHLGGDSRHVAQPGRGERGREAVRDRGPQHGRNRRSAGGGRVHGRGRALLGGVVREF